MEPIDASKLSIVNYPAEVLRQKARPVDVVDENVRAVAARMVELMLAAPGIGLAAPQVGLPWRMFVAHVPRDPEDEEAGVEGLRVWTDEPAVYMNPELTEFSRDLEPYEEGCLSLPHIVGTVRRPSMATVRATGMDGESFEHRGAGLLARCWQHEMDHLDGTLIIDKFSPMDRRRAKRGLEDLESAARPVL